MVGSNIDMEALAAHAAAEQPPAAADAADAPADQVHAVAEPHSGAQGLSRAEEERQQLQRAAAALAAAGWLGDGRGHQLPGGLTLGTATVYRSKGRELEGGEQVQMVQ
jgi:hypothetical protein